MICKIYKKLVIVSEKLINLIKQKNLTKMKVIENCAVWEVGVAVIPTFSVGVLNGKRQALSVVI